MDNSRKYTVRNLVSYLLDPNQGQQSYTKTDEQVIKHIKDSFRSCATNGLLTKNQFNQALAVLETLNFKRLRDTPLADRLFVLFDKVKIKISKGKNGYIS